MSRRRRRSPWAAALAALLAAGALAQEPVYVDRLRVPVADADIGYGHAVTVDLHTGEIFVCDPRTNRILIFDADGYFDFQILGAEDFGSPEDLAVDPEGLLVVIASRGDRRAALELDFDGTFRHELEVSALEPGGQPPRLTSVALSPAGDRVYLLDEATRTLRITDRAGGQLRAIDLAALVEEERRDDLSLGHVDVYGERVLVSLPSEGEIFLFDLEGESAGRIGRQGTGRCELGHPTAAALNTDGEVLVIDQQRMLLSRWSTASSRCQGEYIGIGATPGYLYYPLDLALDAAGRLYISQSWDGRVQIYEGMGAAPSAAPPR